MKIHMILPALFRTAGLGLLGLLAGCAGVTIQDASNRDSPIPVRLPETYLLVSPSPEHPEIDEIKVITLPTGKELRLTPRAGFGSASLEFTLENGALASWGSAQDSTAADSITALTGVVAMFKTQQEAESSAAKAVDGRGVRLYRVVSDSTGTIRFEPVPWPG